MLRISGFYDSSCSNGEGWRSVIFFSGCPHHCRGCHNPETWDFNSGEETTVDELYEMVKANTDHIDGVTLSGGEPFQKRYVDDLIELTARLKGLGLSIWCYTGYTYENLVKDPEFGRLLQNIDVLIDGPFMHDLLDTQLKFRGSSNQRLLELKT
ncbi:MAG: anaerobic ribonucleoside-triphosphate reductase activating protein [Spirochaetales bacterium]|nr:anaerobic ribonucleoside-triphosphate reductase activating protein [Spirochaetales bacterium]